MGEIVKVAQKKSIPQGQGLAVDVKGKKIAIFNIGGRYHAIDDECSHAGGSLTEGSLDGNIVMCPLHGAEFDVETGLVISEPAEDAVRSYKVIEDGEDLKIEF